MKKSMKKVLAMFWLAVLTIPCLIAFSEGKNGEMTWCNLFGVAWMLMLAVARKFVDKTPNVNKR